MDHSSRSRPRAGALSSLGGASSEMIPVMPSPLTRRLVLAAGLWGGVTLVTGCQGEPDGESRVGPTDGVTGPGPSDGRDGTDPDPEPPPDLELLQATLQRTRNLLEEGAALERRPRAVVGRTLALLGTQEQVLADLVRAAGADPGPDVGTPPGGADTGRTSAAPEGSAATAERRPPSAARMRQWVQALGRSATAEVLTPVAGADPANLPLLVALHTQRASSATGLGADLTWAPGGGRPGPTLLPLLSTLRPAVYAVEVVVARAAGTELERVSGLLDRLRALTTEVTGLVGVGAAPPPLGYGLPGPVQSRQQREALVAAVLEPLPEAVLSGVETLRGDAPAVTWSVGTLHNLLRWSAPFGQPLTAFPGMTLP